MTEPLCPRCGIRERHRSPSALQPWCRECKREWAKARKAAAPPVRSLSHHAESAGTAAKREAIAAGRRHVIAEVSYSGGFSVCTCGHREDHDASIRSIPRRHAALAAAMNAHIALANGRKASADEDAA